ncbi:MAG: hypothetical protein CM1200mP41_15460 [Gammaproteobacteria bacterium]|nr:MAG: hypothetical protein CM1200mP41_15460 [Gammaproteobacteria bacterium]
MPHEAFDRVSFESNLQSRMRVQQPHQQTGAPASCSDNKKPKTTVSPSGVIPKFREPLEQVQMTDRKYIAGSMDLMCQCQIKRKDGRGIAVGLYQ